MARHKMVDGVQMAFTEEEETARDLEEAAWTQGTYDRLMEDMRMRRNRYLSNSDWSVMPDLTSLKGLDDPKNKAWVAYRQLLRNITENVTTVEQARTVTWPTPPEE